MSHHDSACTQRDLYRLSFHQLEAIAADRDHPQQEEAADMLDDMRADRAEQRATFGEPEDTPRLDDPWWAHP